MKRWRKYIICLLLVTLPVSLWAGVAAPMNCAAAQTGDPATGEAQPNADAHAHHGMNMAMEASQDTTTTGGMHDFNGALEPCCDSCISVCLVSSLSAINLYVASLEAAAPETHFNLVLATQFLPGPSYPSLYRPPISQS